MATVRSVDFLPQIFQTDTNTQFLSATLDQMIQEPQFKRTQGYIGRAFGPGVSPTDRYVAEPTAARANYQLEPGVVSLEPDTDRVQDVITYPGINDAVAFAGGNPTRPDRLYSSDYYTWDPFVDFDKFVNFSQYFWLPNGPDTVDVATSGVPTSDNFTVVAQDNAYNFSGVPGDSPVLELVRGGNYSFQRVATDGSVSPFWIQAAPGVSGFMPNSTNISSRSVVGVVNNGASGGVVVFNVPTKTAQAFYYDLADAGFVDLVTDLKFNQINNQELTQFLSRYGGIDGIRELSGKTLVFSESSANATAGGWIQVQPIGGNSSSTVIPVEQRHQVWRIELVQVGQQQYISLVLARDVDQQSRVQVLYGTNYSNTQWYKNAAGFFDRVPELTAALDTLYYQDGNNPNIVGRIKLIDPSQTQTIFVNEILGSTQYTSPNGVRFTNGLKVRFVGDVEPATYKSGTETIVITRTDPVSDYVTTTSTQNMYSGEPIVFEESIGGIVPGVTYYVKTLASNGYQFTISETPFGPARALELGSRTGINAVLISNKEYYVEGVGSGIKLIPVISTDSPEYVPATTPDYITINRAALNQNLWSRTNCWFHVDVINAAAGYNNVPATFDNQFRAKRPIIEFRPNIRLWNMGTEGKAPVNAIDFSQTDALSNVEGATSYSINGYQLTNGARVIFAADQDLEVRNKIYEVNFVVPDTQDPLIAQPIIHLVPAGDGQVQQDQSTWVINNGTELDPVPATQAGRTYWFNGQTWALAQQKTSQQQAPLFDVFDADGVSYGNTTKYQSSNFFGSKLFSYAVGDTGLIDPVLQFPLQYLNINNVGDIVFENNMYTDRFVYVADNTSTEMNISAGAAREYSSRTDYQLQIGWQNAVSTTPTRQKFKFTYDGRDLLLDVRVDDAVGLVPAVKLYVNSEFVLPSQYTYVRDLNTTTITVPTTVVPGDEVEVLVLSSQTSSVGFYQVPVNLESNPLNENSQTFTLGTIRTHYQSICQNNTAIQGTVNGANNSRDLGNIGTYGLVILQQSAPLTMAGYFMRSQDYNVFSAIDFNAREYTKFKNQLLDSVTQQMIEFQTAAELLDTALEELTAGRVESQPFYWSDMLPSGAVYNDTEYLVSFVTTQVFETLNVYDYTSANYRGMNVYLNNQILKRGIEYQVATDGPRVTLLVPLQVGDVVRVREYDVTYGSFVPNTPTKMGLYPAFEPRVVTVTTSDGQVQAIQGHDGSITPLFGDVRDSVLLEYETRVFNNLKLDSNPVPVTVYDVLPGQFRNTGYSYQEVNAVLSTAFLKYVGANKLDYRSQLYSATNPFTWNYSTATNRLDGQVLPGAWRGIYRWFYDTEQPHLTPWEMLGMSTKPTWWEIVYGPAPYTSGNTVLWDDLEAGRVADPAGEYTLAAFARPGLSQVIPVDSEGNLLSPFDSVVAGFNEVQFQRSWALGDGGPVEASWKNSSSYPFAVMQLLAVTRPAKFFALFADRDLYRYNNELDQYLYQDRYRLSSQTMQVYGAGTSKASYINWIVDYKKLTGVDAGPALSAALGSLDVRLCYRMASFSDKKFIKLYTEKTSPGSENTSLLIPDESYDLLLYKNQPFGRASYSAVVIQKVDSGYAVFGYSTVQPYFNILQSRANGRLQTISAGNVSVRVATEASENIVQVPYGFVLLNETAVCDFLLSYGRYLTSQGLVFDNISNGFVLDWAQMCQEFLYWSQQGWNENALLNLNPLALRLSLTTPQAVVDNISVRTVEDALLDQNRRELPTRNLNIVRIGNTFKVEPLSDQTLSFIDIKLTSFEHMIVLNNRSAFGDLIYQPVTGARQSRLSLSCVNTDNWTGQFDAPGFVLNQRSVEEWTGLRTYSKGEIVRYKNTYWSALTMVQPSQQFNFSDWAQSDYAEIKQGLLPNLANKADQLTESYNINVANIESDADLLAFGLIGFRPRQYMASLNLSDVSQVNVYRQFIDTKGTLQSTQLFANAQLDKETADYNIYENWAVQRAVYGANANRSYVELRLDKSLLSANPSTVQVTLPEQTTSADQAVLLSNVWKQSRRLTSPDFLPVNDIPVTDYALPSAGYVNVDDADINVFDFADIAEINANLDQIGVGTVIWVAKVNDYDWNIYRAEAVPGTVNHVCDNLDGTSRVIFTRYHNLAAGDIVIVRYFDSEVDGVYTVLSVPALDTVNIEFSFAGDRTVANGTGLGFTLKTMRVAQPSDIVNLPYAQQLTPGARVWIDNGGSNRWQVLEKNDVFSTIAPLAPLSKFQPREYGQAIAQSANKLAVLIGSPGFTQTVESAPGVFSTVATGGVYLYVNGPESGFDPISPTALAETVLHLDTPYYDSGSSVLPSSRGFGNSITFGNQTWAAAGASQSLGPEGDANNGYVALIRRDFTGGASGIVPYAVSQVLTHPDTTPSVSVGAAEFGAAVVLSPNEQWLYVGSPGLNQVHAYALIPVAEQFLRVRSDGQTTEYSIADAIKIDRATQVRVTVDGQRLTLGVDYTATGNVTDGFVIEFAQAPAEGLLIAFDRISQQLVDSGTFYNVEQSATSGVGSGARFTVVRIRGSVGQAGTTTGSIGATAAGSGYQAGDTITIDGSSFGSTSDAVITVGTIGAGGSIASISSIAYTPVLENTFDLGEIFYTATTVNSFTIAVDNTVYRPNIDYTFDEGTQEITFVTEPALGAQIVAQARSHYQYVNTIEAEPYVSAEARFGAAIKCSTDGRQLIVGAPNEASFIDDINNRFTESGAAFVYDRSVQKFVVTQAGAGQTFEYLNDGNARGPIAVLVNKTSLANQDTVPLSVTDTFELDSGADQVTVARNLIVGDTVEIETNQFLFVQELVDSDLSEFTNFGTSVDLCSNDCSLYIGEPNSSRQILKGGVVNRFINQGRVYGAISSTTSEFIDGISDGATIRVNGQTVSVPSPWSSTTEYTKNTVVYQAVPDTLPGFQRYTFYVATVDNVDQPVTDTNYWTELSTVAADDQKYTVHGLAHQITQGIANVTATVTVNSILNLRVTDPAAGTPGNLLSVQPGIVDSCFENFEFEVYKLVQVIESPYPTAYANFGYSVSVNSDATTIAVGTPRGTMYLVTVFDEGTTEFDVGSTTFITTLQESGVVYTYDLLPSVNASVDNPSKFVFGQQITSAEINSLFRFGDAVSYRDGILIAGAPKTRQPTLLSGTYGSVVIYENAAQLPAWQVSRQQNPVVDIRLINSVFTYNLITSAKTQQFDFFDPLQGKILGAAKQNIDYISAVDPANYTVSPTTSGAAAWSTLHVGQVWWDTSTVRFIDPNQDDIVYASRRWGQLFPGSSVDVYQWVASPVPPAQYTGTGVPYSTDRYSINTRLNREGLFVTEYYFWVRGITTTATQQGKTLSVATVAQYIENPRASGITYLAPLNSSTVAIYNAGDSIEAQDTVLHVEYDRVLTNDNVHVEYELIAQGRADAFLSNNLYRKLQDSFCGVDTAGNPVPDLGLSPAERYGVQFRPRQSMFVNRYSALKNYLGRVNAVLAQYPISETRTFALLNSSEPMPAQTQLIDGNTVTNWNMRVANVEELSFQDITLVPPGYLYLVESDSTQRGRWTIYQVTNNQLVLNRVQSYNTPDFWSRVTWYRPGYNPSTKVVLTVPAFNSLETISVPLGSSVKVAANTQGKFEIYQLLDTGWQRVALQDGTVQLSSKLWDYRQGRFGYDIEVFDAQYFDQEPSVETRKIIQAINEELLIDDLLIERNRALTLMFDYILSETSAPEWLVKTSLIDVDHKIRDLVPYKNYREDNQEFVLDYIKEVKPYHVQIREFNLRYSGFDQFAGDCTDFDLPAYYNTALSVPRYTSPVLTPYTQTTQLANNLSNVPSNAALWSTFPYNQWFNNHLLFVNEVYVIDGGSGYLQPPEVTFVGDAEEPAQGIARINTFGQVTEVVVVSPGSGYRTTPQVVFTNASGTGVRAVARMKNEVVRSFRTVLRYDRTQYRSSVVDWTADTLYQPGDRVRYDNRVWSADSANIGSTFDLENWTLIPAAQLSAADRVTGMYVPQPGLPGLDLPLLIDGIDYPGVQVFGNYFVGSNPESTVIECTATRAVDNAIVCENTYGFVPGREIKFSGTALGGIQAGIVYYVQSVLSQTEFRIATTPGNFALALTDDVGSMNAVLDIAVDAVYQSRLADMYLGTRVSDVIADGGRFIGAAEGHGPEELVNGAEFDTVDIRVRTRPGSDWTFDGHGFQIGTVRHQYTPSVTATYSWAGVVDHPVQLVVSNQATGRDLVQDIDYTVNWADQTIDIISGASADQVIEISVYEIGGGSQLYRTNFTGAEHDSQVIVPVAASEINQVAVFRNGLFVAGTTWEPYSPSQVWNISQSYERLDVVKPEVQITPAYYRAVQDVPAGTALDNQDFWELFVPTQASLVSFGAEFAPTDGIALVVFGANTSAIPAANMVAGGQYRVASVGDTNWIAAGVPVMANFEATITGTTMTVTSAVTGLLAVGQYVSGTNVQPGTQITEIDGSTATVSVSQFVTTAQPMQSYSTVDPFVSTGPATGTTGQVFVEYSWSTAQTETFVATTASAASRAFVLSQRADGTNPANMIVTRNGIRLRPASGVEWISDGVETEFGLPERLGISQEFIYPPDDIQVWANGILQPQSSGLVDGVYSVSSWEGTETRQVVFEQPLPAGTRILIAVSTQAGYTIVNGTLTVRGLVNPGDVISVTGWNDTQQQNALTLVFQGPESQAYTVVEPYDITDFDVGDVSFDPGSYDYSEGQTRPVNNFWLRRADIAANRLWVTLDGRHLFEGKDYTVEGEYLILPQVINSAQVVAVTQFTNSVVPEEMEFRIFQDMRGVQAVYRIANTNTTVLTEPLALDDDVIHVQDASRLGEPDLENGVFGVVTVGAERIMYRERNTALGTLSGLRRGTAGTAQGSHPAGARVIDMSRGSLMPVAQDSVDRFSTLSDGVTAEFTTDFAVPTAEAVEVFVGGIKQPGATGDYTWSATSISPVVIEFDSAVPPAGQEITVAVRRGSTWYEPGADTASNGRPLQETNTDAARFLRGLS